MSDTNIARHAGTREAWIDARARVNRGWLAMPRHAIGGRHAGTRETIGRAIVKRSALAWRALFGREEFAAYAAHVTILGGAR